jgi:hypothetical protein
MPVIYVPRVGGGTLILNIAPPPASVVPTLVVVATFRSGVTEATYRDGKQEATHRDGTATAGGR